MVELKLDIPDSFWKEETRWGFRVTEETKRIWAVQLDLLNELTRVCQANGLTFFADSGTMLGAVRHQGFIPWDNDLDFIMARKDYEKLCRIAPDAFRHPYFFQTEETDPGSIYLHAKLRNSLTTGILTSQYDGRCHFNQGIFIDIFPFDNVPDDEEERKAFFERVIKARKKAIDYSLFAFRYVKTDNLKRFLGNSVRTLIRLFSRGNRFDRLMQKEAARYSGCETKRFAGITYSDDWIYDKAYFADPVEVPFEFITVTVPRRTEEILTYMYGDWRKPVIGGGLHGDVIFDVDKPYTEYLDKLG